MQQTDADSARAQPEVHVPLQPEAEAPLQATAQVEAPVPQDPDVQNMIQAETEVQAALQPEVIVLQAQRADASPEGDVVIDVEQAMLNPGDRQDTGSDDTGSAQTGSKEIQDGAQPEVDSDDEGDDPGGCCHLGRVSGTLVLTLTGVFCGVPLYVLFLIVVVCVSLFYFLRFLTSCAIKNCDACCYHCNCRCRCHGDALDTVNRLGTYMVTSLTTWGESLLRLCAPYCDCDVMTSCCCQVTLWVAMVIVVIVGFAVSPAVIAVVIVVRFAIFWCQIIYH